MTSSSNDRQPELRSPSDFPIAVGFMLLICCAVLGAWLMWQQREAESWVRHTLTVENETSRLQIYRLKVAVDVRNSIIGGRSGDDPKIGEVRKQFFHSLGQLRALTADNPGQQARLMRLRRSSDERFAAIERIFAERRAGNIGKAVELMASPQSQADSERLIRQMDDIREAEESLLKSRIERSNRVEKLASIALAACLFLTFLLAVLVFPERRARIRALWETKRALEDDVKLRQAAEARLAHLVENATDAIVRIGLDGICLFASPAAKEVQGHDPEKMIGQSFFQNLHPGDEEPLLRESNRMGGGEIDHARIAYRAADPRVPGSWIWLEASCRLIRDGAGAPLEILASVRDVTARKTLETDLEAERARAESATQAKAAFLANMSHEIRTPMNGVLGFAELLLASNLPSEQRKWVELIDGSGRAMMRLLNDILDFSRIEAGQMHIAREPFDLSHALHGCVKLMSPAAARKDLSIAADVSAAIPKMVVGDALRLRQIALNLLGNAIKFTEDGSVELRAFPSAEHNGQRLVIEVQDTGIGIDPDRQKAIFEEFVQANGSIARRYGGSGLGLAITTDLTRLMGGTIELESVLGTGSTFRVNLPLEPMVETMSERPAIPRRQAPISPHLQRILLVEDHDVNQELYMAMLSQLGWRADLAGNGVEAITMIEDADRQGDPYRLVLMDTQMPELDGLEATRRLRDAGFDGKRLPILALTANAYESDIAACFAAGSQAHLAKPIRMSELDRELRKWSVGKRSETKQTSLSASVWERYRARKIETIDALDQLVIGGECSTAVLTYASNLLHQLAGTAGMFGEDRLGDLARSLELGLHEWDEEEREMKIGDSIAAIKQAA